MTQLDTGPTPPQATRRRSRAMTVAPGIARLQTHLTVLEAERELHARARFDTGGDIGDRAWRAEGETQLVQLDEQIRRLRRSLDEAAGPAATVAQDSVGIGVTVTLRFLADSSLETYVVGGLERQDDGIAVLTPDSPLGRSLLGASVGDTVTYAAPRGNEQVTLVAIG